MTSTPEQLKAQILELTRQYSRQVHAGFRPVSDPYRKPWQVGDTIPYAGRVFTEDEVEAAFSSTLFFWLTLGQEGDAFQKELAAFLGVRHSLLVNSGSSANLIAIWVLTSPKLPPERRIKPGDEVITVAAGFPTTVAPIVQVGAVPVFIDSDPVTGNARCDQLELAHSPGKTKAVMMAHALGNPFDLAATLAFCRKYDLWLVEDNCDALGCSYSMPRPLAESLGFPENSQGLDEGPHRVVRWTGTWGDLSTQSFYPPHHLTMGWGGAVKIVRDQKLKVVAVSFRGWGRECWCPSCVDNTCGKRFGWQLGELPACCTTSSPTAIRATTSSLSIPRQRSAGCSWRSARPSTNLFGSRVGISPSSWSEQCVLVPRCASRGIATGVLPGRSCEHHLQHED